MHPTKEEKRSINTEPSLRRVNQVLHKSQLPQSPYQRQNNLNADTVLSPPIGQFVTNTLLQAAAFAAAIAFGVFAIKSVNRADTANSYAAQALEEARIANQIAMIILCASQNTSAAAFCTRVQADASLVFPSAATALFTNPPSAATSATVTSPPAAPSSTGIPVFSTTIVGSAAPFNSVGNSPSAVPVGSSPNSTSSGAIAGIAVGVCIGFILAIATGWIFLRRRSRKRFQRKQGAVEAGNSAADTSAPTSASRPPSPAIPGETGGQANDAPVQLDSWASRWWQAYRAVFVDSVVSTREK